MPGTLSGAAPGAVSSSSISISRDMCVPLRSAGSATLTANVAIVDCAGASPSANASG